MRRGRYPLVCLLVIAACGQGAGCSLLSGSSGARTRSATIAAVRTDFVVAVKARGELEADQASPIAVPRVPTGALKVKGLAPEGSLVEKGDMILAFDASQLNIQLANHTATFRASGRQIDGTRISRGIEAAANMTERAIAELERDWSAAFQLEDNDIYSQLEILEAALGKSTAEERIIFADVKLLLRGEYYDIDEKILDVEKGQARGKMDRVETSLAQLVLTAPISGMVIYRKNWRGGTTTVGDTLWPGNVVMSIVDPTRTSLKINVFEKDVAGVEEGAQVEVRIDAYMDRVFTGRIRSVSNLSRPIEQGSPVKYFNAVVSLDEGDPGLLKPGMKGEATILVADLPGVVVVPRAAVRGVESLIHVLVDEDGVVRRQLVALGPGDQVRVSVREGLEGGERILLGEEPAGLPEFDEPASAGSSRPAVAAGGSS